MNQELVEILISIYQTKGITKSTLCSIAVKRVCGYRCNVCPIGYIPITYGDISHYLKHLIAIRERVNI